MLYHSFWHHWPSWLTFSVYIGYFPVSCLLDISWSNRRAVSKKLAGKVSNTSNAIWTHCFTTKAGTRSNQIFADYTVFKGKAALSVNPILPKFNESETSSKYDKKGCVMLKFWPAVGERKYDWQKRQMFALSPTEIGSLISLEPGKSCEFFHDPSMKSSNAGQVRKSLSVTPLGEDGYLFSFNVVNNILKINERFAVPVTKAEYTVMRTAFSFILPHIMGWNHITQQVLTSSDLNPVRQEEMRLSPTLEWNR